MNASIKNSTQQYSQLKCANSWQNPKYKNATQNTCNCTNSFNKKGKWALHNHFAFHFHTAWCGWFLICWKNNSRCTCSNLYHSRQLSAFSFNQTVCTKWSTSHASSILLMLMMSFCYNKTRAKNQFMMFLLIIIQLMKLLLRFLHKNLETSYSNLEHKSQPSTLMMKLR